MSENPTEEPKKRGPGRPTKKQQPRVEKLLTALRGGNTRRASCQYAGISEDTLARWISNYADIAEQVAEAEAQAEVRNVAIIQKATADRDVVVKKVKQIPTEAGTITVTETVTKREQGDWKAAAWWLARRRPRDYGSTAGVIVGAKGGVDGETGAGKDLSDLLVDIAVRVAAVPLPVSQPDTAVQGCDADPPA